MNAMTFSPEANEMHAGAAEYDARKEAMEMALGYTLPRSFQFAGGFDDSFISAEQAEWEAAGRDATGG
jgi:hypothetical protein